MSTKGQAKRLAEEAQSRGQQAAGELNDHLSNAAEQSDTWVKNNPWSGFGIGAALGLVVGILIGKK